MRWFRPVASCPICFHKKFCHRLPMFPLVTKLFTSIISEGNLLYLRYMSVLLLLANILKLFSWVSKFTTHLVIEFGRHLLHVCATFVEFRHCVVWRYTGPHPVLCSPFSTSLLSFVFFFYHLWWLESFSRSAWHSRRLLCQHGLLMTPSVCSKEARGYVEVIQILFLDGYKRLAISRWHHRLFEDGTSGFLRQKKEGPCEFRRALKRATDLWRFPCFPRSLRDVTASSNKSDSELWLVLEFAAIVNFFTPEWVSWMGIVLVLATIVPGPRTIACLLTKRQFRTKLQPAVFKLKTIVVIVHKF